MLLSACTGWSRATLIAHADRCLSVEQAANFDALLSRRTAGEPMAYVLGQREFYGANFYVDANVLIPRPETELLVDLALARLPGAARVLDLGTGSGILPITLGLQRTGLDLTGIDASPAALQVARKNGEQLGVQVRWLHSDWCAALSDEEQFALIVSNPPYIRQDDPHLQQGDLRFEPSMALTDHADGLAHIRAIVRDAPRHLMSDGWLLMEHGYDQAAACRALLTERGFAEVASWRDLAGIERVTGGSWRAQSTLP